MLLFSRHAQAVARQGWRSKAVLSRPLSCTATLARSGAALQALQRSCWQQNLRPLGVGERRFCIKAAEAAGFAPPKPGPRARKQASSNNLGKAVGLTCAVVVGAYAVSSDIREMINEGLSGLGELFEDFNDSSREFFEGLGDKIVGDKKPEPWLLELATMKYPENIPTLVLDLDKVILNLRHDSVKGWHVIKRPFADQFFKELSHYYEVVIFSDDMFPVALDIATKWNLPVTGVLHRDFCKKKRGTYVKDLSKLGRKLDRVLMIDHDKDAFQLQHENGILIKAFDGDENDSELADLLEFLKAAATANNVDIRQFLAKFGGGDPDVGRRYLLYKQDQDKLVESRRSVGRVFTGSKGFPNQPQPFGGAAFPR